jgi:hypothetical protein
MDIAAESSGYRFRFPFTYKPDNPDNPGSM